MTDFDSLQFSVKVRDEVSAGDQTGTGVAASAAVDTDNDDHRYELSWKHNGDGWLNEVQAHLRGCVLRSAHQQWRRERRAVHLVQRLAGSAHSHDRWRRPARRARTRARRAGRSPRSSRSTDLAWGAGDHTIKAGIKYKDVDLTAADSIPGNPVFYYDVTAAGTATIPWKAVFALPLAGFDSEVTSNDKQLGVFVQDDWTVNDHLTLNLGIRWDVEENPSYLDFVTPQFLIDSLNTEMCRRASPTDSRWPSAPIRIRASTSTTTSAMATTAPSTDRRVPAAVRLLVRHRRRSAARDLRRRRPRLRPHAVRLPAARANQVRARDRRKFASTPRIIPAPSNGSSCVNWDPVYASDPNALPALLNGMAGEVNLINNDLEGALLRPVQPRHAQSPRATGTRARRSRASSARTASCSRWAIAIRTAISGRTAGSPGATRRPDSQAFCWSATTASKPRARRCCCPRTNRSREESRWGATFSYTFTDAEHNRDINEHYHSTQVIDQGVSVHRCRTPWRNIAWSPPVRIAAPWGFMFAGKLTWSTPIPHATSISCYAAPGHSSRPAHRATAFAVRAGRSTGYQALDLQITKNFEIGDLGSMYLRVDALNVTNEHNLGRLHRCERTERTRHRRALRRRSATSPACRGRCACPSE